LGSSSILEFLIFLEKIAGVLTV